MYLKGRESERIAENYLLKRNYTIHFKNKRLGRYEVDLVCQKEDLIVFVEVKSLSSNRLKMPHESVDRVKQNKIIKVADYLLQNYFPKHECRFDIISITGKQQNQQIEHIKSAFTPEINKF